MVEAWEESGIRVTHKGIFHNVSALSDEFNKAETENVFLRSCRVGTSTNKMRHKGRIFVSSLFKVTFFKIEIYRMSDDGVYHHQASNNHKTEH